MKQIKFEPTITLGNLLSLFSIIVTFVGFALYNERRMTQYEGVQKMQEYRIVQIENRLDNTR